MKIISRFSCPVSPGSGPESNSISPAFSGGRGQLGDENRGNHGQPGFTLAELLTVIGVIGIFAAILILVVRSLVYPSETLNEGAVTHSHEGAEEPFDVEIHVSDFDAVGDGVTDDGPAIESAIEHALATPGERRRVVFDEKTYFVGERMDRWPYFIIRQQEGLVIDGNGAELLFSPAQTPFRIEDSQNITIRNMRVDYVEPTYMQGRVVKVDSGGSGFSFDVQVDEGYPSPPTGDNIEGGGGRHGLVFEPDRYHRKVACGSHFKVDSIASAGEGVYRFYPAARYPRIHNIEIGDRVTHGGLFLKLPQEYRTNQRYAQGRMFAFQIERSADILIEDVALYATVTMAFNLIDNQGDVVFRRTELRRRPGSDRLLASLSDGIHSRNSRGAVILDECFLEAAGDDLFAVTADEGSVLEVNGPSTLVVRGSRGAAVRIHDRLWFRNPDGDLGMRTVSRVEDGGGGSANVTLDQPIEGVQPGTTTFLNLNETARGTTVRDTTFQPVMRQAMQIRRVTDVSIERNEVNGYGGEVGVALGSPMPETLRVQGNRLQNLGLWGIRVGADLSDRAVGNVVIQDNEVSMRDGHALYIHRNMDGVAIADNQVTIDEGSTQHGIYITDCFDITIDGLVLTDRRPAAEAGIFFLRVDPSEVVLRNIEADLATGVPVHVFR